MVWADSAAGSSAGGAQAVEPQMFLSAFSLFFSLSSRSQSADLSYIRPSGSFFFL